MKNTIIAIDGPAASGKGTLARNLAQRLGFSYLDTGKLYRAVGRLILQEGNDPSEEQSAIAAAEKLRATFSPEMLQNPSLSGDEAGQAASQCAAIMEVRQVLYELQRNFALSPPFGDGAVLDGRDIGTVICPDADVKLFVTAPTEIRAQRRYKELHSAGLDVTYGAVLEDMQKRDARDQNRKSAPLKPAQDAVIIDTADLVAGQALEEALHIVRTQLSLPKAKGL